MLSPAMRWMLMVSGPMNLVGAALFAPPMSALRRAFGLPESEAFYLWILSAWVLAFGVAYFVMGTYQMAVSVKIFHASLHLRFIGVVHQTCRLVSEPSEHSRFGNVNGIQ